MRKMEKIGVIVPCYNEEESLPYFYKEMQKVMEQMDVEFELLNDESITHVVLIGRFKWDVRVRLKYARVPDKKIVMLDNMDDFVKTILEETKGNIYTMVCFDMTAILLNKIKEYQDGNN